MAKIQKITPHLWYDKQAVEAAKFYVSIFPKSKIKNIAQLRNTPSGDCDVVVFDLCGQEFMAISAGPYFKFNEAISLVVHCDTQKEIDYYWEKLSAVPESEQCGWLKDKFGLSWQIVPSAFGKLAGGDPARSQRMFAAMQQMNKLDMQKLQQAYDGN